MMLRRCCSLGVSFRLWFRDYASLQWLAIILIYIQIGCSMVGSLGASFSGILLVNMAVSLFALVAIESCSQCLGRTYAALLACMILLDAVWFILFSRTIWNITRDENYGPFFVFSLRLALWMQIIAFSVRIFSSLIWIQMYRLGLSGGDNASYHEPFYRRSLLCPSTEDVTSQSFMSDNILGAYVRNALPYSPLFDDAEDKRYVFEV